MKHLVLSAFQVRVRRFLFRNAWPSSAKDLLVLEEGVLEGRKVFANILKYIRMGASSNFGNMFSVLGASIFLPFVPMAPLCVASKRILAYLAHFGEGLHDFPGLLKDGGGLFLGFSGSGNRHTEM